jgi:ectoine hydroxylase-related dioxygenase (phytanoyl-CoA dioxygenase family)
MEDTGSGGYDARYMNAITSQPERPLAWPSRSPSPEDTRAAQFVSEGYLVEKRLLGAADIERLLQDILKLARGGYPCKSLKPVASNVPEEAVLAEILCIHQPHFLSPVIRDFIAHPKIVDILAQITGAHLPADHWDRSVKCMQSMFFVKGPDRPGQAWHQDEHYIPTRDRSLLGAWIAVDDATIENGCLWVLPKSHRRGILFPVRDHHNPDFDLSTEAYGFDDASEVAVEVPRGSVVFFNGYLLHRSKPNRSRGYRRALVNHYMTAQSLLPWGEGRKHDEPPTDNRRVIIVAGKDPYMQWKPLAPPVGDDVYLRRDAIDTKQG